MATQRWPIIDIDLDDLVLDVDNVRLAIDGLDETGIASYMVEAEDLIGLARDILRDTYIDNEVPVVIAQHDGKYTVMEANRRVAALKAIANPQLLGRHATQLERHLSRYPDADTPTNIRVMVAPSREAAQPVLARLHTGQAKRSWIREQQAIFYHAQLSETVSADNLKTLYPRESSKIIGFVRMGEVRELIRALRYDDADLEDFVKTSKLKMTSLEYAYDRPEICAVLGLKFDSQGVLETKRLTPGQRRGMMHLLGRFKSGSLNTRSQELRRNTPQLESLVQELDHIVNGASPGTGAAGTGGTGQSGAGSSSGGAGGAGATGGGSGAGASGSGSGGTGGSSPGGSDAGTGISSGGSPAGGVGGAGSRGPNRGSTHTQLDFSGFVYQGIHAGLRRRFEELRQINVRDFPNATYDLLRTVLECSIKEYFDVNSLQLQATSTLGPSVQSLAAHFRGNNRRMTDLINAINRSGQMSGNQYAGTGSSLNASNHNAGSFAEMRDVHEGWDRLKPILIELVG